MLCLPLRVGLPVLLTASRRPCAGRGAEVGLCRSSLLYLCLSCKGPRATKEAWALASSLGGLLSSELAYPVVASVFVIRWSFLGLGLLQSPHAKTIIQNLFCFVKAIWLLFPEQFRRSPEGKPGFRPPARFPRKVHFVRALALYETRLALSRS